MNISFRRHLRRKGWVPQEVDGLTAYWEPWRENPEGNRPPLPARLRTRLKASRPGTAVVAPSPDP